ncbi:MAG: nucleoside monophosphate kinase [bacterium]|nr:nucleoside monophosphate kinase [bacterium]
MRFVFFGPEGSGKSTQGKLLAQKLNLPYVASGDIIRWTAANDPGMMGDICREALKSGHYVPDSEMFVLWKRRLKSDDLQDGWVIDGFPRNLDQAKFLDEKLDKYNQKIDAVIFLDAPDEVVTQRLLKRGRRSPDGSLHDSPEKIKSRLAIYHKSEDQVIDLYRRNGTLITVDATKSIEDVTNQIWQQLIKRGLVK